MKDTEYKELARAYVALSNAHRPDLIKGLLSTSATYRSSAVGGHSGPTSILAMMRGFFQQYPDVHWRVDQYRCLCPGEVEFDFCLTATNAETGEQLNRDGLELIRFDDDGGIIHVEVMA